MRAHCRRPRRGGWRAPSGSGQAARSVRAARAARPVVPRTVRRGIDVQPVLSPARPPIRVGELFVRRVLMTSMCSTRRVLTTSVCTVRPSRSIHDHVCGSCRIAYAVLASGHSRTFHRTMQRSIQDVDSVQSPYLDQNLGFTDGLPRAENMMSNALGSPTSHRQRQVPGSQGSVRMTLSSPVPESVRTTRSLAPPLCSPAPPGPVRCAEPHKVRTSPRNTSVQKVRHPGAIDADVSPHVR